jgi:hypothetical protein
VATTAVRTPLRHRAGVRLALAAWALLVAVALAWGTWRVAGSGVALRAAPLMGRWHPPAIGGLLPAGLLAGTVVALGPPLARSLPWRRVPPLAAVTAALWATALAAADGWDRITAPLTTRHEYEPFAARVGDLGAFLRSYVAELPGRPVHVQGHPPGPVVLAWLLDRLGLGGAGWLAALVIASWGAAVAFALVATRTVAGEAAARRAAPALVLLPAAGWAATSLDALFAAFAAASVALAARRRPVAGLAAGLVLGTGLLSTYGMALVVPIALVVGGRRTWAPMAAGVLVPLAVAAAAGFWWPAGLAATGGRYWTGIAAARPPHYLTLVGNPGALALATGPAVAAGFAVAWAGRDRVLVVAGAALAMVALADVSQMARGEVERIWLLFVPLLAVVAPGHRRSWLAAQALLALALQATLASPW